MYSKKESYRTNREQDKLIREMGLKTVRVPLKISMITPKDSLRSKRSHTGKLYPGGA